MSLRPDLQPSSELTASEPEIVFVHNDFLPHNILLEPDSCVVLAVIDFEWSFLGDPMWDIGYLDWWLQTDDYPYPVRCWDGVQESYGHSIDQTRATFYGRVRCPEPRTWWHDDVPPPVGWLNTSSAAPEH